MKIAYHFMVPEPAQPELDGAVQEALWLQERFGGSISYLYPLRRFRRLVPASLSGINAGARLRELDREVDLHHFFAPNLASYPFLPRLARPEVWTVQTSLPRTGLHRPPRSMRPRLSRLVASDPADVSDLGRIAAVPTTWIPPGIEPDRFERVPPPADDAFVLLIGSGPWTRRQFETKGIDQLISAARQLPRLRLVFLLRGVLETELARRIHDSGLGSRTELVSGKANVPELLTRVHAAAVLAEKPRLIKSFPHSALESLASGRPVLTSAGLGIADFIHRHRCGIVLDSLSEDSVLAGIRSFMENYEVLAAAAMRLELAEFSRERFLEAYERVYSRALNPD